MKISICMPVFGRSRMLRQALFSILGQGHADVELVLQDGDVKAPVAEDPAVQSVLALFENSLRYFVGCDRGIFDAVNLALRQSTGDILYFACCDDLLCPGALEAVNVEFERERFGGPHWVYGQTISADHTGKTLGIDGAPTTYEKLLEKNRLGQPAVFWNRKMMALAGMFDPRYKHAADYDLWLRFWARREPTYLDQTLGIFRHHAAQNTNVNSQAVEAEARSISVRHQNFSRIIMNARNTQVTRQAYGDDPIPESVN
ncbi:MAG: glycosyltransferase [Candidatus Acidiferrales bacterium]